MRHLYLAGDTAGVRCNRGQPSANFGRQWSRVARRRHQDGGLTRAAGPPATPGSVESLVLVVDDVEAAREELIARGVEMSEVFHDAGGVFHHAGGRDREPGPDPARRAKRSLASFSDPDGNGWVLQEIPGR